MTLHELTKAELDTAARAWKGPVVMVNQLWFHSEVAYSGDARLYSRTHESQPLMVRPCPSIPPRLRN